MLNAGGIVVNLAAIDCGTNSIRLLITQDLKKDLVRTAKLTRLGYEVDKTRTLKSTNIEETLKVLQEYISEIKKFEVNHYKVVATSALRDAHNKDQFLIPATEILGVKPEILSGYEEARLSFLGATLMVQLNQPVVVVDVGGGSTEIIFGKSGSDPIAGGSLDIGSVRLTERFIRSDPPDKDEVRKLEDYLNEIMSVVLTRAQSYLDDSFKVIGVAGTVNTLCSLQKVLNLTSNEEILGIDALNEILNKLLNSNVSEKIQLGIHPKRADIILAGALIIKSILKSLNAPCLYYSYRDLLDGVLLDLINFPVS